MYRFTNGDIRYSYPDAISSIVFNGSALALGDVLEVTVRPDGWGMVLLLKALDTVDVKVAGEGKVMWDGTHRNFVYWGTTVVTVP